MLKKSIELSFILHHRNRLSLAAIPMNAHRVVAPAAKQEEIADGVPKFGKISSFRTSLIKRFSFLSSNGS